jgi:hypothetical protein
MTTARKTKKKMIGDRRPNIGRENDDDDKISLLDPDQFTHSNPFLYYTFNISLQPRPRS